MPSVMACLMSELLKSGSLTRVAARTLSKGPSQVHDQLSTAIASGFTMAHAVLRA